MYCIVNLSKFKKTRIFWVKTCFFCWHPIQPYPTGNAVETNGRQSTGFQLLLFEIRAPGNPNRQTGGNTESWN